jgi:hypothetical protein
MIDSSGNRVEDFSFEKERLTTKGTKDTKIHEERASSRGPLRRAQLIFDGEAVLRKFGLAVRRGPSNGAVPS